MRSGSRSWMSAARSRPPALARRWIEPLVVQVNDAQGKGLAGALVQFSASGDVTFDPSSGLTGSDGQFSTAVRLGGMSGRYQLIAKTHDKAGKLLRWRSAR